MLIRAFAAGVSALVALAALEATIAARPCAAAVIGVPPGIGTLQVAIDAASPGDELHLLGGIYTGAVVVDKSVGIYCYAVTNLCVIDAICTAPIVVDVGATDVTIASKNGMIFIIGATATEMRIADSYNVKLTNLQLGLAHLTPCGTEATGLEIAASDKVKAFNVVSGHAAYIHDIAAGAHVTLGRLTQFFNDDFSGAAVLIENSSGTVQILKGFYGTGSDGADPDEVIFQLTNSDGVRIKSSTLSTSGDPGVVGILLDASSDKNRISRNRWVDDMNGAVPYVDNGTHNCAKKNFSDPGSTPFPNLCP